VTTVGLSLTIPLSLIGEMIEYSQTSGVLYWIGACIVLLSFVFINHEESQEDGANDIDKNADGNLKSYIKSLWYKIWPQGQ